MMRSDQTDRGTDRPPNGGLVGTSRALRSIRQQARSAALFDEPVLILGETGTGKELVARELHRAGRRAGLPLQVIHCAGLGADVLASELFGHRAGAFTGASRDRPGRLRAASGSTVLLDEVTETPDSFQAAVLGAIERGEVQPVGSDSVETVDVRFVATSNRPCSELRHGNGMRVDLFHRLAAFVIEIPPLRERPEDIEPLAKHFLDQLAETYGESRRLSAGALDVLLGHSFPGNVRELRQCVLRAYAAAAAHGNGNGVISAEMAAVALAPGSATRAQAQHEPAPPRTLEAAVRRHIRRALSLSEGNLSAAARMLDIPRSTLQHYLVKYRVPLPEPRPAPHRSAAR